MNNLELNMTEKSALEQQHKTCRDGKERDRIKALLLRSEGWQLAQIAQALRLHESTIARHIDDFIDHKKCSNSSGGSFSKLTQTQTEELVAHLVANTYYHQRDIVAHIQQCYRVTYTIAGINKWLHKNGFSYKKPKAVPYKVDAEKQAAFIERYRQLKAEAKSDEAIFFMDAVHPTQATKISAGWIKTATDKPIKTTASRTRLNIIGALQLSQIDQTLTVQYPTINGEAIIDFLRKLRQKNAEKGRLHLILDGAGYHKAHIVTETAKTLQIELHYLPPYSPNLNPIERLWKVMNEKVRNNRCFHSAMEFREAINHFFDKILPDMGDSLNTRITDNFQVFNPAFSS
ncbi:MAG: IS630 family transposase [Gammaproteobacteria bacterium]|nr:IS630 family transposase [Gammaproteobacteria bacterium]